VAGAVLAGAVTGVPDGETAYQVPPKVLTPSPVTSPGAASLTNIYRGQPAAVTIEVPLVAFVAASAALMPLTIGTPDPAGAGTRGQNCRHWAEHVECPGESAVSMYTVKPLPSTRTGPNEVVATPSTPPGADGVALPAAPDVTLLAVVVVLPQAATIISVAAVPSRLTVNLERDMVVKRDMVLTSPVDCLGVTPSALLVNTYAPPHWFNEAK
jgi:hypothetical protein